MLKRYDAAVSKFNVELLINNVKRIAAAIRENKKSKDFSLDLADLAICLAFYFKTVLKNAVNVDTFFTLVNEKTRFFCHRSSEFVRKHNVANREKKNARLMTDVRYAVYQRTVMLYDKLSQYAADVACFAIACNVSEKVNSKSNKLSHSLAEVATSKLVAKVATHKSLAADIKTLVDYVKK